MAGRSEASDFVVEALQDAGFHFGTDGSVEALWGYLRTSHVVVSPSDTRRGDVLFFRLSPPTGAPIGAACDSPDHAGIVSGVDGDGRIAFVEARGGRIDNSYVDPLRPQLRRDAQGRVHNSFLREKRISDPPDSPNFAGEMLCSAVRPRS